jgi:hypothetical protein
MNLSDSQRLVPRIDYTRLPPQWKPQRELPKMEPMEMDVPMGDKLPRIKVVLNGGTNLKSNRYFNESHNYQLLSCNIIIVLFTY